MVSSLEGFYTDCGASQEVSLLALAAASVCLLSPNGASREGSRQGEGREGEGRVDVSVSDLHYDGSSRDASARQREAHVLEEDGGGGIVGGGPNLVPNLPLVKHPGQCRTFFDPLKQEWVVWWTCCGWGQTLIEDKHNIQEDKHFWTRGF